MGTDAQENCIKIPFNFMNWNIPSNRDTGMYLYTSAENDINIIVQHRFRQTIAWNTITKHAAQLRALFIYNGMMTHQLQIEGTGQTARTAADDSHTLAGGGLVGSRCHMQGMGDGEMLDAADVDGIIHHVSAAACLAGMLADKGAGRRERVVLTNELDRILIPTGTDKGNITRNIHMCRTQRNAGYRLGQSAGAAVVAHMLLIIIPEALHAPQYHVGGFVADGTVCGIRNGLGGLFNAVNGVERGTVAQDVIHQPCKLAQTDTAGRAFAAGLRMAKL